jgi:3-hydroxy-9,10-secoandrosta-1,3,5(10)-triene-9,17-dione monooxygenase reductase component
MNEPSLDSQALRDALGAFATGVAVVSTVSGDGRFEGLTVNSFTSVSLDPPLILWCLSREAPEFPAFQQASHFAVHVLAAGQRPVSDLFASPNRAKFANLAVNEGLGGVPLLTGCLAILECRTEVIQAGGDHIIVIGRVERLRRETGEPLLYWQGGYRTLAPV